MSEARLYTVEVRMKEIEQKIYSNFAHSKEVVKKLIFALEQENLPVKSPMESTLGNPLTQSLQAATPADLSFHSQPQDGDLLFLKRLLFIKNEIDESIPGKSHPHLSKL